MDDLGSFAGYTGLCLHLSTIAASGLISGSCDLVNYLLGMMDVIAN